MRMNIAAALLAGTVLITLAGCSADPEVTTTVQDNSLTTAKYKNGSVVREKLGSDVKAQLEQTKLSICRYGRIMDEFGVNGTTQVLYAQSILFDENNL